MSEELSGYKVQLEQVEVALAAEPNNADLVKLKRDLEELIQLQEQLGDAPGTKQGGDKSSGRNPSKFGNKYFWEPGMKCMAKTKTGQRLSASIDSISDDKASVTFFQTGEKEIVSLDDLQQAPMGEEKNYVFQSTKAGVVKKDWRQERERRKARAQKKEQRRKAIEEEQEKEKKTWKSFNQKALTKGFKGVKKITASASSIDGPRHGIQKNTASISSRTHNSFGFTNRGNMDSLF